MTAIDGMALKINITGLSKLLIALKEPDKMPKTSPSDKEIKKLIKILTIEFKTCDKNTSEIIISIREFNVSNGVGIAIELSTVLETIAQNIINTDIEIIL